MTKTRTIRHCTFPINREFDWPDGPHRNTSTGWQGLGPMTAV